MNSSVRVKNEVNQPNVSCLSVLALQVVYHPNAEGRNIRALGLRVARTFFSKTVGKPKLSIITLPFESNVLGWAHTYVAEYKVIWQDRTKQPPK